MEMGDTTYPGCITRREENALDTVDRALGTCGVTTKDRTSMTLAFWKERKGGKTGKVLD